MQVIPALLNTTIDEFFSQYEKLMKYYNYFQIDIADGKFVPNTTITISEIAAIVSKTPALFKGSSFDFHLMVQDYDAHIKLLESLSSFLSIKNILIHFSALRGKQLPQMKQFSIGVVLNPEDSVTELSQQLSLFSISCIQIMTIVPGFQGNAFKPEQLSKIRELRDNGYTGGIFIDGSVNAETLPVIMSQEYKPDIAGSGSYLARATPFELPERVKMIETILQSK